VRVDDWRSANGQGNGRRWLREFLISLAVIVASGVVLAALGPFGSFAGQSFAVRLGYWLPAVLLGFLAFRPILALGDLAAQSLELPRGGAIAGAVLIAAVPGTLAIAWLNGALRRGLPPLDALAPLYVNVAIVGALVTLVFLVIERRGGAAMVRAPAHEVADLPTAASAIIAPRPPAWTEGLVALEMEDHYVRVHGPGGTSQLLLMRMSDAERALASVAGLRVHRSWWVAIEAVEGHRREGRRLFLSLRRGLEAPVARDRVAAVRAAGLLERGRPGA